MRATMDHTVVYRIKKPSAHYGSSLLTSSNTGTVALIPARRSYGTYPRATNEQTESERTPVAQLDQS